MDFNLSAAQRRLQGEARALAQSELAGRAAAIDRSEEYPWENVRLLKEAGFFGMTIPAQYGGRGLTYFDAVLVIEQIAQACGVSARIVVEANMGAVGAIMEYGSERQKQQAAELVLDGKFGQMAALKGNDIEAVPLKDAVAKQKTLDMRYYEEAKAFFPEEENLKT